MRRVSSGRRGRAAVAGGPSLPKRKRPPPGGCCEVCSPGERDWRWSGGAVAQTQSKQSKRETLDQSDLFTADTWGGGAGIARLGWMIDMCPSIQKTLALEEVMMMMMMKLCRR